MTDKKKLHQILSSLWKNDDSVGKTYYNQALQDVQTAIDLQEEPVSDELEKAAEEYIEYTPRYDIGYELEEGNDPTEIDCFTIDEATAAFIEGAKWQKQKDNIPVSDKLEEACEQLAENARKHKAETSSPFFNQTDYRQGVIDGAKWQKENLWKSADGDDLPEYDREVIVLTQPYPLEGSEFAVSFAHRPDPKGWDGKSITTGKVEHYTPKTYDKGGWNISNVKYWLDVYLPKEIEL